MYCYLLDLPVEIQLMIKELLRDEDVNAHTHAGKTNDSDDDDDDDDDDDNDNDDDDTPNEKQDEPINSYHDLLNWSCTCSYYRNLLAPSIFKSATLVNHEKSGASLSAVGKSPHHIFVKELHFIGSALGDAHRGEAGFSDVEGIFPRSVDAALRDLQRFPNLERLSIMFDYDFFLPYKAESPEQVLEAEASTAWRSLMSRTYSALMHNKSPHFKHLEIRRLIWIEVSTFSHPSFYHFLSQFEHFTFSIQASQWGSYKQYNGQVKNLGLYFFNHLTNVTKLSVKIPCETYFEPHGPIHLGVGRLILPPKVDQFPLLATLRLDNLLVCTELVDFLVCHKDTLEELTLCNCLAWPVGRRAGLFGGGIYWYNLFESFFDARPGRIRCFELELVNSQRPPSEEDEVFRFIMGLGLKEISFPYLYTGRRYGMKYGEDEEIMALQQRDRRSWDRLMELVRRNANKAS